MSLKLEFGQRLGDDWRDLAATLEISAHHCRVFPAGHEAYAIWEYLEARNRLADLPSALHAIKRQDLADLFGTDGSLAEGSAPPAAAANPNSALHPLAEDSEGFVRLGDHDNVAPPHPRDVLGRRQPAWERARPERVRDAVPRRLGVHAAIQVDGAAGDLPVYVPRDLDSGLREALAAGGDHGCFVLLVGGSSVGKSRTLYEAVVASLPDWWLVHPSSAAVVAELATATTPRAVIWLDEIQRYLDVDNAVTGGMVRALLQSRMVLVGTIWPDEYRKRTTRPAPDEDDDRTVSAGREVLDLAQVFDVKDGLSAPEMAEARRLANVDGRLRVALESTDGGLTQVLAAAPELMRHWQLAPPPSRALITAAVQARHLGVIQPVPEAFLADAVFDYLTPAERATAGSDWLGTALEYARTQQHGAAATVNPVSGTALGTVAGYVAADYLVQHADRERGIVVPPDSFWRSAAAHVDDLDDRNQLGWSAMHACLNRYAAGLFEPAAQAGHVSAMRGLAQVLLQADDASASGSWLQRATDLQPPDVWLAHELEQSGLSAEAEDLLARAAAAGDPNAAYALAKRWEDAERSAEASQMMEKAAQLGSPAAVTRMSTRKAATGHLDEAVDLIRAAMEADPVMSDHLLDHLVKLYERADRGDKALAELRDAAGDGEPSRMLALGRHLLRSQNPSDREEGIDWLRRAAQAGQPWAMSELAEALQSSGRADEAKEWHIAAARAGSPRAIQELSSSLPPAQAIELIKELAGQGDPLAIHELTERLDEREAESWLRAAADRGNAAAMEKLIWVLRRANQMVEAEHWLRQATMMGVTAGVAHLAELLEATGRGEEAARLRRYGLEPDGTTAEPWQ